MDTLYEFIRIEVWVILGGLVAVVIYQLVTGRINLGGLLYSGKPGKDAVYTPERAQLLIVTIAAALFMLGGVLSEHAFVELPEEFAFAFFGSHGIYLGSKTLRKKPSGGS